MSYWYYRSYDTIESDQPYDHDGTAVSCDPFLEKRNKDNEVMHDDF